MPSSSVLLNFVRLKKNKICVCYPDFEILTGLNTSSFCPSSVCYFAQLTFYELPILKFRFQRVTINLDANHIDSFFNLLSKKSCLMKNCSCCIKDFIKSANFENVMTSSLNCSQSSFSNKKITKALTNTRGKLRNKGPTSLMKWKMRACIPGIILGVHKFLF